MARRNINIQDGFLFANLKEATELTFELVNGQHLQGRIRRFDRFAVVVETGRQEILFYKHAIATISKASSGG